MKPTTRKLSHAGARKKGSRAEYYVRDQLVKIGIAAKRIPMSGALAWMKGDVGEFNVEQKHIHEVKNCERLDLGDWWRQAASQSLNQEIPVLHFTANHRKFYSAMRAVDFDNMVAAYEEKRPELSINLIDYPNRKNFWKFQAVSQTHGRDVYFWELAGKTEKKVNQAGFRKDIVHPDEQLVIFPFDQLYIMLRKYEVVITKPL